LDTTEVKHNVLGKHELPSARIASDATFLLNFGVSHRSVEAWKVAVERRAQPIARQETSSGCGLLGECQKRIRHLNSCAGLADQP
jgi:hypothetical protein